MLIAFPYEETLAPSWHLEQERGRHQELVSKGGEYCKLLAAAGEMWGAKGAKVWPKKTAQEKSGEQGEQAVDYIFMIMHMIIHTDKKILYKKNAILIFFMCTTLSIM